MYRQIALDPAAKDFHRLLWQNSNTDFIKQFRMTRVTYGIASSAFHSTRSVVEVAHLCKDQALSQSMKQKRFLRWWLFIWCRINLRCQNESRWNLRSSQQLWIWATKMASRDHEITLSLPEILRESTNQEKIMDNSYKIKKTGCVLETQLKSLQLLFNFDISRKLDKTTVTFRNSEAIRSVGWSSDSRSYFKNSRYKVLNGTN